jgi:cytochrome c peroxidase
MTGDYPHGDGKIEEDLEEAHEEVRNGIAARIDFIPAYRALFEEAYPADRPDLVLSPQDPVVGHDDDLTYAAVGDAIGHFMESLVMTDAPFDHYLQGDLTAISDAAKRGAEVFMEDGRCSSCHAGDLFSDFENQHRRAPGRPRHGLRLAADPDYLGKTNWDFGLEEITTNREDRFKPARRRCAARSPRRTCTTAPTPA